MKSIFIDGVGEIELKKSKRAKNIIMRLKSDGKAIVTAPAYVPYYVVEKYARSNSQWLSDKLQAVPKVQYFEGKRIGKSHFLHFEIVAGAKLKSRVDDELISVTIAEADDIETSIVKKEIEKACVRALRRQAEQYLSALLHSLASRHDYHYREVRIKKMSTRWGSCSSNKVINLSLWLMQLPDELIKYVCCHELAHLQHPHHQKAFWEEVARMIPDYKTKRAALRQYKPSLL